MEETSGCFTLINKLLKQPTPLPSKATVTKKQESANLNACREKISCGHFSAAIHVLSSNGVAPRNEATLAEIQVKHPTASPPCIPSDSTSGDPITVDAFVVLKAIKSFPKGTSCGRDGLRAQHLIDAMSGAASAVANDLVASITGVVNLWLAGKCPDGLGEFIVSAPLTPLLKPGGGLRPIAVGTIWRRLVSKVAAYSVGKVMTSYLVITNLVLVCQLVVVVGGVFCMSLIACWR